MTATVAEKQSKAAKTTRSSKPKRTSSRRIPLPQAESTPVAEPKEDSDLVDAAAAVSIADSKDVALQTEEMSKPQESLDLSQMEDTSHYDPDDPHQLGKLGEAIAANYLRVRDYKILNRNWRGKHGEVDIVALDQDVVVLVEVKSSNGEDYSPEEAVDWHKTARYRKLCLEYLMQNESVDALRMDVIGVTIKSPGVARVHHIMSAVSWDS